MFFRGAAHNQDTSELEERQDRERDEKYRDPANVLGPHDDVDSALLPEKARRVSFVPPAKIPRMTDIQEDVGRKLESMSQRARFVRLCIFVVIEFAWLGFVLACHFHVIVTGSDQSTVKLPGGIQVTRDTLLKSGLSTIGIIVQLVALLPVADIIVEIYSGEWSHILARESGRLTRFTDRVSTLTSSFVDRSVHMLDKRSSLRYRIAFAAGVLSLMLQAIALGALTISSDIVSEGEDLTIGALAPGRTDPTAPLDGGSASIYTALARKVLTQAARYEYVTWIQDSKVDFMLNTVGLLYGMPPRELIGTNTSLQYKSDALQFQYKCQWLAPTYMGGSLLSSNWSFGGDTQGTMDYNAIPASASPARVYGLWPLIIMSGSGAGNGSFAWLFIGSGTGTFADSPHTAINLAPATSERTYNASGWSDLIANNTNNVLEMSSDASVLFCDPNMQMVTISATLQNQQLHAEVIGDASIGNLDWAEGSRMLGRGLNGMPWDSVPYLPPGRTADYEFGLSELGVKFALVDSNGTLPMLPISLPDIENSLQSYVTIAGASAYLEGSVGNTTVTAQRFRTIQRLVCSWPQWGASVALFALISILMGSIILLKGARKGSLVPLTLASVVAAVDTGKSDLAQEASEQETCELKSPGDRSV